MKCDQCNGQGRYLDDVICGHNERCVERVHCLRCNGTGQRDLEAEERQAVQYAINAVERCKHEVAEAQSKLAAARKCLSSFRRKTRKVVAA